MTTEATHRLMLKDPPDYDARQACAALAMVLQSARHRLERIGGELREVDAQLTALDVRDGDGRPATGLLERAGGGLDLAGMHLARLEDGLRELSRGGA